MANIIDKVKEQIKEGAEAVEKVAEKVEEKLEDVGEAIEKKIFDKEEPSEEKVGKDTNSRSDLHKELEGEKLAEAAEKESLDSSNIEKRKKALLEKAAKLKKKLDEGELTSEELKEKVKIKKKTDMLIPLEEYVKAGIYLGTKVVTPNMRPFVYRRRADGLAIFNTDLIDEKLKEGVEYLSKFNPENTILICKRQAGWRVAEKFSELTGIRVFTKKYPAGILTNTTLPDFFENELTIITDAWIDKNALNDTLRVNKKVLMICDTNNFSKGADQIILGNNKSARSLGVIFYLLTKGYCKAKKIEADIPELEWWTGE